MAKELLVTESVFSEIMGRDVGITVRSRAMKSGISLMELLCLR